MRVFLLVLHAVPGNVSPPRRHDDPAAVADVVDEALAYVLPLLLRPQVVHHDQAPPLLDAVAELLLQPPPELVGAVERVRHGHPDGAVEAFEEDRVDDSLDTNGDEHSRPDLQQLPEGDLAYVPIAAGGTWYGVMVVEQTTGQPLGVPQRDALWIAGKVVAFGGIVTALAAWPLFMLIDTGNIAAITVAISLGIGVLTISYSVTGALLSELFPARLRYTGVSLGYNLAGAITGFLPFIATALMGLQDEPSSTPAIAILAVISLITAAGGFIGERWRVTDDVVVTSTHGH